MGKVTSYLSRVKPWRYVVAVVLLCAALLSAFPLAEYCSDPAAYERTIQSIDSKRAAVLGITGSAAATATAIAMIPDDATTPIAEKIMDISGYLTIVVCALVLEKSLLTILGAVACRILIPLAAAIGIAAVIGAKKRMGFFAVKIAALSLVLATVVPVAMQVSDKIYEVNRHTAEMVSEDVMEFADNADTEEKTWWQKTFDKLKNAGADIKEEGKKLINRFIDAVVIFLVAYCAMPILVVWFMLWLVKLFFGITIPVPKLPRVSQYIGKSDEEDADEQPKKEMAEI